MSVEGERMSKKQEGPYNYPILGRGEWTRGVDEILNLALPVEKKLGSSSPPKGRGEKWNWTQGLNSSSNNNNARQDWEK